MTVGLASLRVFRSNSIISTTTLTRGKVVGGIGLPIGILNGNGLAGGLSIGLGTCSTSTTRGVRTLNKGTRIVWWYLGRWGALKPLEGSRVGFSLRFLFY